MTLRLITPPVLSRGKFTVELPFTLTQPVYTCIALQTFGELEPEVDVYSVVYQPNGLNESDYLAAVNEGVVIVTLADDQGNELRIPNSHITSYPNIGGIPYVRRLLSIDLGSLPANESIETVVASLETMVKKSMGLGSIKMTEHTLGPVNNVSFDQHVIIDNNRKVAREGIKTDYERLVDAERKIAALQTVIDGYQDL